MDACDGDTNTVPLSQVAHITQVDLAEWEDAARRGEIPAFDTSSFAWQVPEMFVWYLGAALARVNDIATGNDAGGWYALEPWSEELIDDRPVRVAILYEGAKLTAGDRDKEYGDPRINMACAGELKRVVRAHLARAISPEEQEALDMVLTKISRYVTGSPKRDTFVDGATYFAILGELASDRPTTDIQKTVD
ncbi:MAG: hypothetical protein HYU59_05605 [Magnetospirillum gryphiswaldense]|nr:hypothetical protein [Magnetospirillum gryphiswaldense]